MNIINKITPTLSTLGNTKISSYIVTSFSVDSSDVDVSGMNDSISTLNDAVNSLSNELYNASSTVTNQPYYTKQFSMFESKFMNGELVYLSNYVYDYENRESMGISSYYLNSIEFKVRQEYGDTAALSDLHVNVYTCDVVNVENYVSCINNKLIGRSTSRNYPTIGNDIIFTFDIPIEISSDHVKVIVCDSEEESSVVNMNLYGFCDYEGNAYKKGGFGVFQNKFINRITAYDSGSKIVDVTGVSITKKLNVTYDCKKHGDSEYLSKMNDNTMCLKSSDYLEIGTACKLFQTNELNQQKKIIFGSKIGTARELDIVNENTDQNIVIRNSANSENPNIGVQIYPGTDLNHPISLYSNNVNINGKTINKCVLSSDIIEVPSQIYQKIYNSLGYGKPTVIDRQSYHTPLNNTGWFNTNAFHFDLNGCIQDMINCKEIYSLSIYKTAAYSNPTQAIYLHCGYSDSLGTVKQAPEYIYLGHSWGVILSSTTAQYVEFTFDPLPVPDGKHYLMFFFSENPDTTYLSDSVSVPLRITRNVLFGHGCWCQNNTQWWPNAFSDTQNEGPELYISADIERRVPSTIGCNTEVDYKTYFDPSNYSSNGFIMCLSDFAESSRFGNRMVQSIEIMNADSSKSVDSINDNNVYMNIYKYTSTDSPSQSSVKELSNYTLVAISENMNYNKNLDMFTDYTFKDFQMDLSGLYSFFFTKEPGVISSNVNLLYSSQKVKSAVFSESVNSIDDNGLMEVTSGSTQSNDTNVPVIRIISYMIQSKDNKFYSIAQFLQNLDQRVTALESK